MVKALGKVASSLRTKLGESLASVQKFNVPIEATTSSLEALKTFSMGLATKGEKGDAEAIPFLRRAIELDPNFALAYAILGVSYANLSQPSLSAENLRKAYELRDRVSEKERLRISANYYAGVTGEYSFQWRFIVESEDGTVSGRAVDLKGRARLSPAAAAPGAEHGK